MAQNITKITMVKRFTYRGDATEEWSNGYVLRGLPPVTTAEWDSLAEQIIFAEQAILNDETFIVRAIGHNSTDPGAVAVYEKDYTVPGPPPQGAFVGTGGSRAAGDQAACIEWLTNLKTVRGKPIYLRKYFHGPFMSPAVSDDLLPAWVTAATTYAGYFTGSTIWGGLTNPQGTATVVSSKVLPYITTRTLERRGKRKKAA